MSDSTSIDNNSQSSLITLPLEIQDEIFSYLFKPWSLAIFDWEVPDYRLDDTVELTAVGNLKISGPPHQHLHMTCHFLHTFAERKLSRSFTGIAYITPVDRLGGIAAKLSYAIRRWYRRVHTLSSLGSRAHDDFNFHFLRHFRQLRTFECEVVDTNLFKTLRLRSPAGINQNIFLDGTLDQNMEGHASEIASRFFHLHHRLRWDDVKRGNPLLAGYTFKVKVLVYDFNEPFLGGAIVQCEGLDQPKVTTRVVRYPYGFGLGSELVYWEDGTTWIELSPDTSTRAVPEQFRWVSRSSIHESRPRRSGLPKTN